MSDEETEGYTQLELETIAAAYAEEKGPAECEAIFRRLIGEGVVRMTETGELVFPANVAPLRAILPKWTQMRYGDRDDWSSDDGESDAS